MKCPICEMSARLFHRTRDWNRCSTNETFQLIKCESCGSVSLKDPPNDMSRYYEQGYYKRPQSIADLAPDIPQERYKIDLTLQYKPSGRLLEIGPSHGVYCHLAKEAGFDVSAIEVDPQCVRFLNEKVGIKAIQSADPHSALRSATSAYDVIAMWHVIEHLPDPIAIIDIAASKLASDGILIIATPNPQAWQAHLMRARWPHWDSPRHLHILSMSLVREAAEFCGLRTEMMTTNDPGGDNLNRVGWVMYFDSLIATRVVGLVAHRLARRFDMHEGKGSCYLAIFRKCDGITSPSRRTLNHGIFIV